MLRLQIRFTGACLHAGAAGEGAPGQRTIQSPFFLLPPVGKPGIRKLSARSFLPVPQKTRALFGNGSRLRLPPEKVGFLSHTFGDFYSCIYDA